jgi:hypothetical protein
MTAAHAWETIPPQHRPDFRRDRWKRPLIRQLDGSDVAYTRCTTYVGAPEDLYNVHRWENRQIAKGLAARSDLLLSVAAHADDKGELNRLCDAAKEAAGASAASTRGTAIHKLSELVDEGRELPRGLDAETRKCLDAYAAAMRPFKVKAIEARLVQDKRRVAGSTDRILSYRGMTYIGDLKTGSTVDLGTGKIAGQLAMYAHSIPYDVVKEQRLDAHGASTQYGLVIHLPAERPGEINLHWIDLETGWRWCQLAGQIRDMRSIKAPQWLKPFDAERKPEPKVSELRAERREYIAERDRYAARRKVLNQIAASDSRELLTAIWERESAIWDDGLTEAVKARLSEIAWDQGMK